MKNALSLRFGSVLAAVALLAFGAFALAQNQTSTTQSQSQSGTGQASSSSSASARSGGSFGGQAGGQNGGQAGGATGAGAGGSTGAPVKGLTFLVHWTPNVGANGSANVITMHNEYVKATGAKYGVLTEGIVSGSNSRLAIVQGTEQAANEFAMGSPLVQARMATIEVTAYNVEYSRIGVISEVKDPVGAKDSSFGSATGGSSGSVTGGSTKGSGGSGN